MPFYLYFDLRIRFEPRRMIFKHLPYIRAKVVTVKVKVDVSKRTVFGAFAQSPLLKSVET